MRLMPALLLVVLVATCGLATAGEIEPRAYVNTPVGVSFLVLGYTYAEGDLTTADASPIQDAEIRTQHAVAAYAHAFGVFGRSAKVDLILPYTDLSGTATAGGQPVERNVRGPSDPRLRLSVNFIGAPALSLEEFKDYRQDIIVGASLQVSGPFGQYDNTRMVNIGSNRWFVKPDLGISKAIGDFAIEASAGVFIFGDNDDFYSGNELTQAPLYTTQIHATWNIGRGLWAAMSGTYDHGGRTSLNGTANDDVQRNSRLGVMLAMPIDRRNSLKLFASSALHTTIGNDYDMAGIAWQLRWGAGL